ncbi:MAG TPA: hypothetical protein PKN95_03560 [Verrucomicrobiota bacterium]|nr:hypothetical protein [Verrucomicrobiota bacterium]HNT14387.1 hypothetical protein [Verrucomicrobiota bacterium]
MTALSQHILFRNFGWKLLSLILAVVIWLTIRTFSNEQGEAEKLFPNLPIKIVSSTADVRAYQVDPPLGAVTLRGRPGVINRLDEREIHLLADVSLVDASQISRQHLVVTVPNGVTVVRTEPLEVRIIPPPRPEPRIIITPPKAIE